ncbi:hypothetical protein [Phenylobacterium sp.]|uniref:hypothetical protein n=1 Tax=Phenylobacterium sp. TaxID=1871053 RepID=UPI001205AB19|nr:hypothetical protein [Phenylobacterium sp.]THD53630.1 MAG: hypothetical protein E8A12_18285 [Phenylobacterium sp.]
MTEKDEIERRRLLVAAGETDIERWSRPESFSPQWAHRANLAAQMIPAYASVLDLGAGAMDLEQALPEGCSYLPCDLVRRDERTIVCDLNRGEFPEGVDADVVTMLGVLEYIRTPLDLLLKVRAFNRPLVCSYSITDRRPQMDRALQGWINSFDFADLLALMRQAGFRLACRQEIDPLQDIFKWEPDDSASARLPIVARRVAVVSYYNDPNFGDRLGFHVINSLLPANAVVTHATINPWSLFDESFDLVIIGIGNSLNAPPIAKPQLQRLVESAPHTLGVFGTQYRHQYREWIDPALFDALLSNLTTWWARYEEDIEAFGRGRKNVRHLGDFLISAFPMATPTRDRNLVIPADFRSKDLSLDRVIQQIQSYRRVTTARLHPMLCALTSADQVRYQEQRETAGSQVNSGKFRSQLYDIFGRTYDEDRFFDVDRDAVVRYKSRVEANMAELRAEISRLLA